MRKFLLTFALAITATTILVSCGEKQEQVPNKVPIAQRSYIYLENQKFLKGYVAFDILKAKDGTIEALALKYVKLAKEGNKDAVLKMSTDVFRDTLNKKGAWAFITKQINKFDFEKPMEINLRALKKSRNKVYISLQQGEGNSRAGHDVFIIQRGNKLYLGGRFEKVK